MATKYIVLLFQNGDYIDRGLVRQLQRELDSVVTTPREETEIHVWVHSPGGDAHAAYKLILDLRSRCSSLEGVVPDYAKSSATLMLLGMDKIYMAPAAELGPLDVQIEHPDRENKIVSGLDVANSLESLGITAIDLALAGGSSIIKYTGLPRAEVLSATLRFLSRFLEPAVAKLDPHLIHEAARELQVARHYAIEMLERRCVTPKMKLSRDKAQQMINKLVKTYPSHGSIICRDEAINLGLPIESAEDYPEWALVREVHGRFMCGNSSLVMACPEAALEAAFSPPKPSTPTPPASAPASAPTPVPAPTPTTPATDPVIGETNVDRQRPDGEGSDGNGSEHSGAGTAAAE